MSTNVKLKFPNINHTNATSKHYEALRVKREGEKCEKESSGRFD